MNNFERLENPLLNKGSAFSEAEREAYGLDGLLPPHIEHLDEQVMRMYEAYLRKDDDLERHIFLRALQDRNEVVFYKLVTEYIEDMMPMIYTPVVGKACQQFSEIYRRARGLFISYPLRHKMDQMLANSPIKDVKVIVVTDGERILGLGDQGAGGMGIPIGKLSLYTAIGGIHPSHTLPILLDVGTNNKLLHDDPFYIGWRHERITGDDYYDFVDQFVQAVKKHFPNVLLQFEDFARQHAEPLLNKYRDQLCTFNDDIQGTAAVTVGTVLSALNVNKQSLKDANIVMMGAGSAGCGIAEALLHAMTQEGLSESDARARFFMVDRFGLIHDGMKDLTPAQSRLAQPESQVGKWDLLETVKQSKANILVGVCGQPGVFNEPVVKAMSENNPRPIIFPLSNPTSQCEGIPADISKWSDGKALIATGSPFDGIAQCNNSYIFPAMGLGILTAQANRVTDNMFYAAAKTLAAHSPALKNPSAPLLPPQAGIRDVAKKIGLACAKQAVEDGVAPQANENTLQSNLDGVFWKIMYTEGC